MRSPALLCSLWLAVATPGCLEPLRTASQESPFCTRHTCPVGACGAMPDGCAGTLDCGGCRAGESCADNVCRAGRPAAAITAGTNHTCALLTTGRVRCWGGNQGQLGDGTTVDRLTPVDAAGMDANVSAIAAGALHTCALLARGSVHCWGRNTDGQLGDGSLTSSTSPTDVVTSFSSEIVRLAAGGRHTCAVAKDGSLYCWGLNSDGQLGQDNTASTSRPALVPASRRYGYDMGAVREVAVGQAHTCALSSLGEVYCWGSNGRGQLQEHPSTISRRTFPTKLWGLSARQLALGAQHSCVLLPSGTVRCFGDQERGQLGSSYRTEPWQAEDAEVPPGAQQLSTHLSHTCALTGGGEVYCWGSNEHGQLGSDAYQYQGLPQKVAVPPGIRSVAVGGSHACALDGDGVVHCWGSNAYGQLGNGSRTNSTWPVAVVGL